MYLVTNYRCIFVRMLELWITQHNIVDTLLALKNSTPQTYSAEYLDRISQIKNGNTTISDIKTVPDFFSPLCIEEDSDFWINKQIARYYDVDKVTLKTE